MTTILVLALCYVVAASVFLRWMKSHAPEGYETEEEGFVMTARPPAVEKAPVLTTQSEGVRPAWLGASANEVHLRSS